MRNMWFSMAFVIILPVLHAGAVEPVHARVSFEAGGAMLRGSLDDDWSHATLNLLVLEGDTLWVDQTGLAEVEMPGGAFLRLADGSKADILRLSPGLHIRGWTGSFYIQQMRRGGSAYQFETPACLIQLDPDSMVRIDITPDGATTISVRWGSATAGSDAGSRTHIRSGERVYVDLGYLPSIPTPFDRTMEDAFDHWNRDRAKALALGSDALRSVTPVRNMPLGVSELSSYGEWVVIDRTPYWRPTVVVDFVPYRHGYWSYTAGIGHVWIGSHPFSYVTSHYGRWTHHPRHGWLWVYRDTWAPAWCYTYRIGPRYVWTPIGIDNRPVAFGSAYFTIGNTRFSLHATSVCDAYSLGRGPGAVYAAQPTYVNITLINNNTTIWNPSPGRAPVAPAPSRPSGRPALEVRDYSPQRVIRGPETGSSGGRIARDRAVVLESSLSRDSFRRATPGTSSRQTSVDTNARTASVRSVRLDNNVVRAGRNAQDHTQAASAPSRAMSSGASSQDTALDRANTGFERPQTGGRSVRTSAAPRSDTSRTETPQVSERTTRTGTSRTVDRSSGSVTPRVTERVTRTDSPRAAERTTVPPRVTERTTRSQTPASSRSAAPETPRTIQRDQTSSGRITQPDTRRTVSVPSSTSRSSTERTVTLPRTPAPDVSRDRAPGVSIPNTSRQRTTPSAPVADTSRFRSLGPDTTSRPENRTPSVVQRDNTPASRSSSSFQTQGPSRSQTIAPAPRTTVTAPSPSPRVHTTPSAPSRSRESSPVITPRPEVSSPRSVPGTSSPSVQAPSPTASPRVTLPQGGSGTRGNVQSGSSSNVRGSRVTPGTPTRQSTTGRSRGR